MNIHFHILDAGKKLTNLKEIINKTAKTAIGHVTQKIPVDNVDIVFYENKRVTLKHLGFGGRTITENLIMIPVDREFPNIKKSLEEELIRTLAHELYHCLRKHSYNQTSNLLDSLINEGLADHFGIEITQKPPEKWDTALTDIQLKELTKRAEKEYTQSKYNHHSWFFGSEKENISRWTGYTIGFNLVGKYLKKYPRAKPSTLYTLKSTEFI